MRLIDITRPIFSGMPVWPGDTPAEFTLAATKAGGSSANVGRLRVSVHTGTHADAPFHYNDAGAKMDEILPGTYVGPARVVDIRGHATVTTALLAAHDFSATPRVLFRSDTWTNPAVFPSTWPLLAADVPAWLGARGVKLVGLDVPSIDHRDSKDLLLHHACDAAGLVILENLDLSAVAPGVYELIALPLKIRGGDGSPIRAVLRTLD
jgi:arylformamidase